tara:strand:+ start:715 stop:1413 length:699 start_codon:yes stop_codon:yes gene_type:complete
MNKKIRTFEEFLKISFPTMNPFLRKDFSFFHNLIKWISLRIAFVLFKIGITANIIDFFGLLLIVPIYYLLYISLNEMNVLLFFISYLGIFSILSIDFMDGILARANEQKNIHGEIIDDLLPEIIRFLSSIVLGYLSNNIVIFILSIFNAIIQQTYISATSKKKLIKNQIIITLLRSRYSFHSIRIFSCLVVPFSCILYLIEFDYLSLIICTYVLLNLIINFIWIYLTLLIKK